MTERNNASTLAPLVAVALGWVASCSWRGMVESPNQYTSPAFVAAALVGLVGLAARRLRLRWFAVLGVQLLVVLVWFHHHLHADKVLGGWLPTPHGIAEVADRVRSGISQINTYAAPVPRHYEDAHVYLIAASILVIVLVDLIACGLHLPAWSGLPVLVALTIPISVLDGGLPALVYVAAGLLFALLLAVSEADRAIAWGHAMTDRSSIDPDFQTVPVGVVAGRALSVGGSAMVIALILSLGVPVGDGLFRHHGGSGGNGGGPGSTVELTNPLVDLRRDLVRNNHLPLLDARTDAKDPSYVRLTVLDEFKNGAWVPSPRDLAETNTAQGNLPAPIGVDPLEQGTESTWYLETTSQFHTTWLPTPFPTRSIFIDSGDWRFDSTQLDIASVGDTTPTGVSYRLTAFTPALTAAELDRAAAPPSDIVDAMTVLPTLPKKVVDIAKQVTAGGTTEYDKVALLQSWFRSRGGFTYSLNQRPGGGLSQLTRFLTTDKVGYCEQFSAAMAIMARALGIPARVVVGFLNPKELSPGKYVYTSDDLHAWPEIYFRGYGWIRFEPTPSSRTGIAPAWTESSAVQPTNAPATPTKAPTSRPRTPGQTAPEATPTTTATSDPVIPVGLVLLIALALLVLALGAPAAVRSRQRARRFRATSDARADVENLWAELQATAVDLGLEWPEERSPRMVAEAIGRRVLRRGLGQEARHDRGALDQLVSLVERARYSDTFSPGTEELAGASAAVRRWSDLMREAVSANQVRLARVVPRSLLTGRLASRTGSSETSGDLTAAGR